MDNANEILFRCSGLGHIITRGGKMTDTLKAHLADLYVSAQWERRESIKSKFLTKGNEREEHAITLLSRVDKRLYKNNKMRLNNAFITGELDIYMGKAIDNADETIDTKASWSANTFMRAKVKPLDKTYKWQGVGYMWLSGAKRHTVAYCLVNGLSNVIISEKNKAKWSFADDAIDIEGHEPYIEKCKEIERNHIFDMGHFQEENPGFDFHSDLSDWNYDIPYHARVHTITFERNEKDIAELIGAINMCRDWMNKELFKVVNTTPEQFIV